jgi:hypothetical protein
MVEREREKRRTTQPGERVEEVRDSIRNDRLCTMYLLARVDGK